MLTSASPSYRDSWRRSSGSGCICTGVPRPCTSLFSMQQQRTWSVVRQGEQQATAQSFDSGDRSNRGSWHGWRRRLWLRLVSTVQHRIRLGLSERDGILGRLEAETIAHNGCLSITSLVLSCMNERSVTHGNAVASEAGTASDHDATRELTAKKDQVIVLIGVGDVVLGRELNLHPCKKRTLKSYRADAGSVTLECEH